MSNIGKIVLVVGIIWGLVAFNMETSLGAESTTLGGMYIPSQKVINLDLLERRRSHLMMSGFTMIIGTILTVYGSRKEKF